MSGLIRQTINLPMGGMDSKTDPFQIPLGKLYDVENATFVSPGRLSKRNGYSALTASVLGGGTISSATSIFTRGNEVCVTDNAAALGTSQNVMYSYDQGNAAWVNKGKLPSAISSVMPLANTQYNIRNVDMAVSGTVYCVVYDMFDQNATSPVTKGVGYAIIDSTTGNAIVAPTTLDAAAGAQVPRVVVFGSNFCIYYSINDFAATGGIWVRTIPTATPNTAPSSATQLTSGVGASASLLSANAVNIDVCAANAAAYVSFLNRSGGVTVFRCTSATAVASTVSVAPATPVTTCIFADVNGQIALGTFAGFNAQFAVFSSTLGSTIKALTTFDTVADSGNCVTGISTASGSLTFFVGTAVGLSVNRRLVRMTVINGVTYATATVTASYMRSVCIAGKPFLYGTSPLVYLPVFYDDTSNTQSNMYLVDANGVIVSKALQGVCAGLYCYGTANSGASVGTVSYVVANSYITSTTAVIPQASYLQISGFSAGVQAGATGLQPRFQAGAVAVTFSLRDTASSYQRGEIAGCTHLVGGVMMLCDSTAPVEHGFLQSPGTLTAPVSAGGSMGSGVYSYKAIYSWMDAQGQVHRSAPSAAVSATTSAGQNTVTVTIPTLRLTSKNARVDLYRTLVNGTIYYQVTNFGGLGSLYNDKTVDTVSFADALADSSISSNPTIYTTGGVLQNDPPPPCGAMTVHRNRLFVVDSNNPTQVWYSKQVAPPGPVEFSGFQILNIDPKGGAITGLASLDDKLIIFKADRIFMVLGQGPDSTGGQNDYTDSILVTADTGCLHPRGIVLTPDGLMVRTPKGIYLLSRALQMQYIGAPVERYTSDPNSFGGNSYTRPLLMADRNQVWFCNPTDTLVYDYLVGQWSRFIFNSGIQDVTMGSTISSSGTFSPYLLLGTGIAWVETAGVYSDPDVTFIPMSFTTPWIQTAQLAGFQRVHRMLLLGDYTGKVNGFTFTVGTYVDFSASGSTSGPYTVSANVTPFQYRFHLAQQKCEAVKFTYTDANVAGADPGPTISGLALEIGTKRGLNKLPATLSKG